MSYVNALSIAVSFSRRFVLKCGINIGALRLDQLTLTIYLRGYFVRSLIHARYAWR
jgi:hypothetical protein